MGPVTCYCVGKYLYSLSEVLMKMGKIGEPIEDELFVDKLVRCPCSTKYHNSYSGGLLKHLLNVTSVAIDLYNIFEPNLNGKVTWNQLIFCALIHDLGKLGNEKADFYLINPDESKREKEPFIVNSEMVSIPHEIRTLYWLDHLGITGLTEEEYQAICFHAGPYTSGYMENIRKESPLLVLLHSADNLAAKIIEQ